MDRTLLFYSLRRLWLTLIHRPEQSRVRDAQANRRLMDRLDQKYPQWTKPVHGTTYTNGLRSSVSTTKQRLHQLGGGVLLAYVPRGDWHPSPHCRCVPFTVC